MNPDVLVRRAGVADTGAIGALLAELGHSVAGDVLTRNLVELIGLWPAHAVFVAEVTGRVVGLVTAFSTPTLHHTRPVGRVSVMVVAADITGSGVGTRLLRHAESFLAEAGCGRIEITSALHRERAHRFYRERGYAQQGVRLAREL